MKCSEEAFTAICESLKHDVWVKSYCTLECRETGMSIWTANIPIINCHIYKPRLSFTLIQKLKIQKYMSIAMSEAIIRMTSKRKGQPCQQYPK